MFVKLELKMEKAFFTNIRSQIIPLLDKAEKDILIAMAWFTSGELFQALLNCINRGVHVELVLLDNATNFMYYAPDFNKLIEAGGILRIAGIENGFMHHKFCIIDDSLIITGSYNWTYYAETRNIENIVISDNKEVVLQYQKEFNSLVNQISKVSESPRLDWEDIEMFHDINFDEINYEIEEIAKVQHLPERKVVKPTTIVTIEERPLNLTPISRYNIGLKTTKRGDNCSFTTMIPSGTNLPFTSNELEVYNYSDYRDNVMCTVLYVNEGEKHLITEKAITEITSGRTDWELKIRIQFTLVQSGDLFAEIRCIETGKVINIKTSNPEFVDYAR